MNPVRPTIPVISLSEKWRAILGSTLISLVIIIFLSLSVLREVKALARDANAREAAHQASVEERRAARDAQDNKRHAEVVKRLNTLATEFRQMTIEQQKLKSVTPVEAMKDRARVTH